MEYTYKSKDYPKEITLHYPEIIPILKNIQPTLEEFNHVQSLPTDTLREDLENILLREIGIMRGKDEEEVDKYLGSDSIIVSCLLIYMVRVANVESTLDVVLELLRQPSHTISQVLGDDMDEIKVEPVLYVLTKDHPSLLKSFLLEEGISHYGKEIVCDVLGKIGLFTEYKNVDREFAQTVHEVMDAYIKDYDNGQKVSDEDVISYLVNAASDAGLHDMYDTVIDLFYNDMVNENVCGDLDTVLLGIEQSSIVNEIETNPEKLMYGMPRNWEFFFPSDGGVSDAEKVMAIAEELGLRKDKNKIDEKQKPVK